MNFNMITLLIPAVEASKCFFEWSYFHTYMRELHETDAVDFTGVTGNYELRSLLWVSVNLLHTIFPQCIMVNTAKK